MNKSDQLPYRNLLVAASQNNAALAQEADRQIDNTLKRITESKGVASPALHQNISKEAGEFKRQIRDLTLEMNQYNPSSTKHRELFSQLREKTNSLEQLSRKLVSSQQTTPRKISAVGIRDKMQRGENGVRDWKQNPSSQRFGSSARAQQHNSSQSRLSGMSSSRSSRLGGQTSTRLGGSSRARLK